MSKFFRSFTSMTKSAIALMFVVTFVSACRDGGMTAPKADDAEVSAVSTLANHTGPLGDLDFPSNDAQTTCNAAATAWGGGPYTAIRAVSSSPGDGVFNLTENLAGWDWEGTVTVTTTNGGKHVVWAAPFMADITIIHAGGGGVKHYFPGNAGEADFAGGLSTLTFSSDRTARSSLPRPAPRRATPARTRTASRRPPPSSR
jgi:hypothetical protein